MSLKIRVQPERLAAICRKWGIVEMSVFGSAARDDFGPESDIDLLISFDAAARITLFDLTTIRDELTALFGRPVDLVERPALERHHNPWLKHAILSGTTPLYRAA